LKACGCLLNPAARLSCDMAAGGCLQHVISRWRKWPLGATAAPWAERSRAFSQCKHFVLSFPIVQSRCTCLCIRLASGFTSYSAPRRVLVAAKSGGCSSSIAPAHSWRPAKTPRPTPANKLRTC
jgi:hypothetical protein